ncbi:MAG TPA: alanine--tRNA ligase, partial [Acidimicrobiales bacterium]
MDANGLRAAFTRYFADRGHTIVPSASLIPHDPSVLFTIAGMVPFKPYFLGEEPAPWPRATSIQKCFRTPDIEIIGTDTYHNTFFEMLGNFSFGDYFKEDAIPMAWELLTGVLGHDGDRLWVTVHDDDDEAEQIWIDKVGVPPERIQRMGDEDNFWAMGDTGPCGYDSEIFFDKGEAFGPDGGPKHGGSDRFVEIWNLVFMQFDRDASGALNDLPRKNIDTGAGLERNLQLLQGVDSVFDTDLFLPLIDTAASILGAAYGAEERTDVALRVLADHGRAFSMLVGDGVLPANEGRGYVLRRVVRRAVLAARRLGVDKPIGPPLVGAATEVLGDAYPELRAQHDLIVNVIAREEAGFDRTLRAGLGRLEEAIASGTKVISGDVAFTLHDTHGFPVELTEELAHDAGVEVDRPGFDAAMAEQRERARAAAKSVRAGDEAAYRALVDQEGPTTFVGRGIENYEVPARILAVLEGTGDHRDGAGAESESPGRSVEIFLD